MLRLLISSASTRKLWLNSSITSFGKSFTSTLQMAFTSSFLAFATIFVLPSWFAVITPLVTLAILSFSLLHIISLLVASSGKILADTVILFPFSSTTFCLSKMTLVTLAYTVISILSLTLPSNVFAVIVAVPELNPVMVP